MTSNFEQLKSVVINNSEADTWIAAKAEWTLVDINYETGGTCECGQYPITQRCIISNRQNGNELVVGNVCINQFGDKALQVSNVRILLSGFFLCNLYFMLINLLQSCFANLKKISDEPGSHNASKELRTVARNIGILKDWEFDKYNDIADGKRTHFMLGHDRFQKWKYDFRKQFNEKINLGFHTNRPLCHCNTRMPLLSTKGTFIFILLCFEISIDLSVLFCYD